VPRRSHITSHQVCAATRAAGNALSGHCAAETLTPLKSRAFGAARGAVGAGLEGAMIRAAFVGLGVALIVSNCGPRVHRAKASLPADVQIGLARVDDVWVAGFVAEAGKDKVDLNVETVRLVRQHLRRESRARVVEAEPLNLASQTVFSDHAYWRRQAEDRRARLVVTGIVRLLLAPAQLVQRGRRTAVLGQSGRTLDATVVVIDGRNGAVVARQTLPRRMLYATHDIASGLGLYFEMMEQSRQDWLRAIAGSSDAE